MSISKKKKKKFCQATVMGSSLKQMMYSVAHVSSHELLTPSNKVRVITGVVCDREPWKELWPKGCPCTVQVRYLFPKVRFGTQLEHSKQNAVAYLFSIRYKITGFNVLLILNSTKNTVHGLSFMQSPL